MIPGHDVIPLGEHEGWARQCVLDRPVAVKPWLPAVETWEYGDGVWSYKSVCRRCNTPVEVYGQQPHHFCPGCGVSLAAPDDEERCVVCGTRSLGESISREARARGEGIIWFSPPSCHECGHTERRTQIPTEKGWTTYGALRLADLPPASLTNDSRSKPTTNTL